jgi:succinyl-diaminopimelate desuccinylase
MPDPAPLDPVALTAELVRRASVTPHDAGALDVLAAALTPFGFTCRRADRGGVANLYARWGTAAPAFGFNGHTDVVPPGDAAAWTHPPFAGVIADGALWGRGSVDMKSGVAAFAAAACAFVTRTPPRGSVVLMITGDEEGEARDGTRAILDWMAARGERLDACIVGEPTSAARFGDAIKIGRRGSMTVDVTVAGVQGHAAYPERAKNPLPALARLLDRWASAPLDEGTAHFGPSTLAITTIDVGNPASNVIPAAGRARANIRFNDAHDSASVLARLRAEADAVAATFGVSVALSASVSGESFLTAPGPLTALVSDAVAEVTGAPPAFSTAGGTSDARFVKDHCPVVEVGLTGRGMHAVDERADIGEIRALTAVYGAILRRYFASA